MGRPIQKKWFGSTSVTGKQIVVNGVKWKDGTTDINAYIVKQKSALSYVVSNGTDKTELVFLVNAAATSTLMPGQCYILATPYGGSALPCAKINQYRVDLFNTVNTVQKVVGAPGLDPTRSYSWKSTAAAAAGQADLVTTVAGTVAYVTTTLGGKGYFTAPTVTFGSGSATATAVVANGAVTAIHVTAGGSSYVSAPTVTVAAPPAIVTALGTVTLTGGVVTSVSITNAATNGYYTVAPTVTFGGATGSGATGVAVLTDGHVTGVTITAGRTTYTTPTVTFAAPTANVTATATAVLSA